MAGGAVSARPDQLPMRRIAGDATAAAGRLVIGRLGRLNTYFAVTTVTTVIVV
jgi:hypothetical protein